MRFITFPVELFESYQAFYCRKPHAYCVKNHVTPMSHVYCMLKKLSWLSGSDINEYTQATNTRSKNQ